MKYKIWFVLCAVALLVGALLPNGVQPVLAQAPEPPQKEVFEARDCPSEGPCQDENGNWYMPDGERLMEDAPAAPAATGGPDDFGYTWSDTVPFNWVDATNGTDAGFSGTIRDLTDAISLPFIFKYYENAYMQVYVSSTGYLTFSDQWVDSSSEIPYPEEPNNVIAPLWSPLMYANSGTTARAFYKTGGSAPNRYFVAEWYRVTQNGNGLFTFEVQLFENGDILFQYKEIQEALPNGYYCTSSGIEDSEGQDGLTYKPYCNDAGNIPVNTALRFTRPGTIARTKVNPLYHGGFTHSGQTDTFNFKVTNNGELGNDTYDFSITSLWPVTLYGPDGSTLLSDTDGDTYVDTGSVPQGTSRQIYARVAAPGGLALGDKNTAFITVSSSLNPYKAKTVQVESTVPASFTQIYSDDNASQINLEQNWPAAQFTRQVTDERGYENAVVETPGHTLVTVWSEYQSNSYGYGYTLSYSLLDKFGQVIRPATSLTQLHIGADYSGDSNIVLAAAPDGKVGLAWVRYAYDLINNNLFFSYELWFAVLNADGSLAYGPAVLPESPMRLSSPTIAASGDNRFMLAWEEGYSSGGSWLYEVYTTIRASSGAVLAPVTKMADGVPGSRSYRYPSVTALNGNRFLLAYYYYNSNPYKRGIMYRAYDSAGALLKPEIDSGLYGSEVDGVELSGGNLLLAAGNGDQINYTLLNGLTLDPLGSFNPLDHPSAFTGTNNLSVTSDFADHGILTWQDQRGQYIYYALVHANGALLSGPAISSGSGSNLSTSYVGASATTNSWAPQEGVDASLQLAANYGAAPGGTAVIGMNYANNGFTTAANPQIVVTLPAGLTYLGALPNTCTLGATLTCNLPDLAFGDNGSLQIYLGLPQAVPIGTTYVLQAAINSAGETYPADNDAETEVFAGLQVFLPSIIK